MDFGVKKYPLLINTISKYRKIDPKSFGVLHSIDDDSSLWMKQEALYYYASVESITFVNYSWLSKYFRLSMVAFFFFRNIRDINHFKIYYESTFLIDIDIYIYIYTINRIVPKH